MNGAGPNIFVDESPGITPIEIRTKLRRLEQIVVNEL